MSRVCRWVILLFAAGFVCSGRAHEVGLSTAEVRCGTNQVDVEIVLTLKDLSRVLDLDRDGDGVVAAAELWANQEQIGRYLEQSCVLLAAGNSVPPTVARSGMEETNAIRLSLSFPIQGRQLACIRFELIRDLPEGHRMLVTVLDAAGAPISERLLTQDVPEITFACGNAGAGDAASQLPTFFGFVKLGVEHIGTGYDHLLFLFALLLVTKTFRSSLVVISFFTLAHSITLAAATFNLVHITSRITEPLIAASIVYVGLENIWRKGDPHGRWALTFAFGLVHGFGFASVLREMGVGARGGGVTLPLLGFNLGVELGQLAVAAIVLPMIWQLRKRPGFDRWIVPACSWAVVVLGSYWLVERLRG